jgi:omega-6 fatty acid desaturase (delta-12 desaturase)
MFYLQHQFEHTSWEYNEEWDFFTASIHGSSYVDLSPFLRWLTGNVGCHHVHHLNTRIPCYKIREATEDVDQILKMPRIHFGDMVKHFDCVLWDEQQKKLIRFSDLGK